MADKEGPVLHQNHGPNQAPNQNPPPNEDPQNAPHPLNPFMPNATSSMPAVPQRPQLNWSYFKPEYMQVNQMQRCRSTFTQDKRLDGHTHEFPDQVKVQRFCLTFVGEARLWYESLKTDKCKLGWFTKYV